MYETRKELPIGQTANVDCFNLKGDFSCVQRTDPVWEISNQNSRFLPSPSTTEEELQKYLLDLIIAPEMRLLIGGDFVMVDEN